MRAHFLCFLLTLCFLNSFSQSGLNIDSLKQVVTNGRSDSVKLEALNWLGQSFMNNDSALYYANRMLEITKGEPNIWTYRAYQKMGQAYRYKGDLELAIDALLKALDLARDLGTHQQALIYITLGDVYGVARDDEKAYLYHRLAISLFRDSPDRIDSIYLVTVYNNLGDKFLIRKHYDSARRYFDLAVPIAERLNRKYELAILRGNIGLVKAGLGLDVEAEQQIRTAIKELKRRKEYYSVSVYLTYMADIYADRGHLILALSYAEEAIGYARMENLKEQLRDASLKLSELHELNGNLGEALRYHKAYLAYKDSLHSTETVRRMADLRTEYEVRQKQNEVDLLKVEKRNQQLLLFAVSGFAVALIIFALIVYRFYQSKTRINVLLERQKQDLEALNQTKDKFFSIISHDLRGPVSSFHGISRMIKFLVVMRDTDELIKVAEEIDHSVDRLSVLLDNLLNWAIQQQGHFPNVPEKLNLPVLSGELVQTMSNMAGAKNIELTADVAEPIELWADRNMTMTILRNLVSNALKFTPEGGKVVLSARESEAFAEISVADSGVGIPKEQLNSLFGIQQNKSTYGTSGEKGLGLGLHLVHEFIEMNGGKLHVSSSAGKGTVFTIFLPLFESQSVEA